MFVILVWIIDKFLVSLSLFTCLQQLLRLYCHGKITFTLQNINGKNVVLKIVAFEIHKTNSQINSRLHIGHDRNNPFESVSFFLRVCSHLTAMMHIFVVSNGFYTISDDKKKLVVLSPMRPFALDDKTNNVVVVKCKRALRFTFLKYSCNASSP